MVVTGKFRLGTLLLAGGPLPPLVEDDKEEMGEVEGPPVSVPDYLVLDQDNLFRMEGNLWDDYCRPGEEPVGGRLKYDVVCSKL